MSRAFEKPVTYHMYAYRGDTFSDVFDVFQSDGTTAYDFTDHTVEIDFKEQTDDAAIDTVLALDNKTLGGISITSNQLTIKLTPTQLNKTLTKSFYNFDMKVTDASGDISTWLKGRLHISGDVTD